MFRYLSSNYFPVIELELTVELCKSDQCSIYMSLLSSVVLEGAVFVINRVYYNVSHITL